MTDKLLKWVLKFSGYFEIIMGIFFIFIHPVFQILGYITIPLFNQLGGVELVILGFLLVYSARDIEKYIIIIFCSIILRFVMCIFDFLAALYIPELFFALLFASIYDIGSAALTLILLWKSEYIFVNEI